MSVGGGGGRPCGNKINVTSCNKVISHDYTFGGTWYITISLYIYGRMCGALVQLGCDQYTGEDVCYKIYYDNLPGYSTVHVGGHPQVSIEVKVVRVNLYTREEIQAIHLYRSIIITYNIANHEK